MDVNELLRQIAADPNVVDTWDAEQTNAVLTKLGVDVAAMQDRCINGPIDERMERVIAFLDQNPQLIPAMPYDLIAVILEYLGASAVLREK